jgi:hypothetical protein
VEPDQQNDEFEGAESWATLKMTWDKRARIAGEWLQTDLVVADIGCGLMTLEAYLPKATTYVPMDLLARDSRTLVFDLRKDPIPLIECDVAVMLGVLEYIDDVVPVLEQLNQFPRSVISYNHFSSHDIVWKLGLRPKLVTWRNRHTRFHFRRLLKLCGLQILRERRVRLGEALYEVMPGSLDP